jgi:hypothetical protein
MIQSSWIKVMTDPEISNVQHQAREAEQYQGCDCDTR